MAKRRSPRGAAFDEEPRGGEAEEARVFRDAVSDVTPLRPRTDDPREAQRAPRPRRRRQTPPAPVDSEPLPDVAVGDEALGAADALSFRRPGVRDQMLRQLRRGRYRIEAELDLHGLSQSAARDQLAEFIAACRHAGLRCVRIVHGKGYRSGARGPVLKIAVNAWLKHHAAVLAFTSARPLDGGTGAVYVLLRS